MDHYEGVRGKGLIMRKITLPILLVVFGVFSGVHDLKAVPGSGAARGRIGAKIAIENE